MKALNLGFVKEETVAFNLTPGQGEASSMTVVNSGSPKRNGEYAEVVGCARVMGVESMEAAVWRIGGASLLLEIVALANVSTSKFGLVRTLTSLTPLQSERDLTNAISVLDFALGTSWQNSEDMERIREFCSE